MKGQKGHMRIRRYPVIIEPTSTGYSAYSPDVPGCITVGETVEGTCQNFREALLCHFDAMREIGSPIPEPSSSVAYVELGS